VVEMFETKGQEKAGNLIKQAFDEETFVDITDLTALYRLNSIL
jgi:hypothetical protein